MAVCPLAIVRVVVCQIKGTGMQRQELPSVLAVTDQAPQVQSSMLVVVPPSR
jgi:hypothetical protein